MRRLKPGETVRSFDEGKIYRIKSVCTGGYMVEWIYPFQLGMFYLRHEDIDAMFRDGLARAQKRLHEKENNI